MFYDNCINAVSPRVATGRRRFFFCVFAVYWRLSTIYNRKRLGAQSLSGANPTNVCFSELCSYKCWSWSRINPTEHKPQRLTSPSWSWLLRLVLPCLDADAPNRSLNPRLVRVLRYRGSAWKSSTIWTVCAINGRLICARSSRSDLKTCGEMRDRGRSGRGSPEFWSAPLTRELFHRASLTCFLKERDL